MAKVEIIMPHMGESVFEATITKWLKKEGDKVNMDESLVEIATDKVDSEIISTAEGTLFKCLFHEGDVVQVGKPVAIISTLTDEVKESPKTIPVKEIQPSSKPPQVIKQAVTQVTKDAQVTTKFLSPLIKNIAKEEGISLSELEQIKGTGEGGRITKKDVLSYLPNKSSSSKITTGAASSNQSGRATSLGAGDEIIEMDRMRKLIAEHMIHSKQTSAHVTSFVEADVTNVVIWRDKVKQKFEDQENEKLTFTPVFIDVLAKAIKEFPMINVSVDGSKIIKHKSINIGMATALPNGNLIVPVIKNADTLSIVGLTKKVNDLANRARNGNLSPDEVQGGTYTMTNVGSFGNIMGTPIINQPQVAIMALGTIKKKPAVIETEYGDTIGIRYFMYLSHSYDHRVVDGALGGQFVKRVADLLEQWDVNRNY